jgi:dephospho-CoA kinase
MHTTRLGLTGGIGSGKSTVAHMLLQLGAAVIDADALSKQATGPGGAAMPSIKKAFGASMVASDGSLNRNTMRQLIVSDPQAKAKLEAIVHPAVGQAITNQERLAIDAGKKLIALDIPLLVESGRWRALLDHVVVIDCSQATQLQRVLSRPTSQSWTEHQAQNIISLQATRAQRLAAADTVICNDGIDLQTLHTQVLQLAHKFGL